MICSNRIFFPSKIKGVRGVGFVGESIFGYSNQSVDTVIEAPARFGKDNKITLNQFGAFSFTNYNCFIRADKVGRYCSIAPNVSIGMGEHDYSCISSSVAFEMSKNERLVKFTGLLNNQDYVSKIRAARMNKRLDRDRKHAGGGKLAMMSG